MVRLPARITASVLLTATLLLHSTTVAAQPHADGRWLNIGPAPILGGQIGLVGHERSVTGRVSAVAINPRQDDHWLVGAASGGVWETRDAGRTWMPLTDDQASLAIGAIAFAPGDPDLVYVGTGEAIEAPGIFAGLGVLTLRWDGKQGRWRSAVLPSTAASAENDCEKVEFVGLGFSAIAVHPTAPGHLVAATRHAGTASDLYGSDIARDPCKLGILRYQDGRWESKPELRGDATDLQVHPGAHSDAKYFDCMYAGLSRTLDVGRTELRDVNDRKPMLGVYRRRGPGCADAAEVTVKAARPASPQEDQCLGRKSDTGRWRRIDGPWDDMACQLLRPKVPLNLQPGLKPWWYKNWDLHLARTRLAIAPKDPNVVYVGISTQYVESPSIVRNTKDSTLLGLWRTSTAWATTPRWVQIPTAATDGGSGALGYCASNPPTGAQAQCFWNHVLSVDANDPNVLYAGGIGLWKAEIVCEETEPGNPGLLREKCVRWTEVSQTLAPHPPTPRLRRTGIHVDQQAMAWTRHGRRLVVGNDGGVWSTTDAGRSWTDHNSSLSVVQFYRGAVAEATAGAGLVMLGGTQDNGVARWRGTSWDWVLGGDGGPSVIASANPDTHWAVATVSVLFGRRLRRSVNGGKEFTFAEYPLIEDANSLDTLMRPLAACPNKDDVILVGGRGTVPATQAKSQSLWKSDKFFSTAASPTWVRNFTRHDVQVTAVAFAAFDSSCDTYAFGTNSGHVWLTTTGGAKWYEIKRSPPSDQMRITQLAFAPDRRLYVSRVDRSSKAFGLVARTETEIPECLVHATLDWKELPLVPPTTPARVRSLLRACPQESVTRGEREGRPSTPCPVVERAADEREHVNTIAVHPLKRGTVFVGTNAGMWGSTDHGDTWTRHDYHGYGMPNVPVLDIKISPKTGQVVAFTYGRGAFLWQEKGWCDGAPSAVVGTNFQSCGSQALIRSGLPVPLNDVVSAP